jgi:hypothetical protein
MGAIKIKGETSGSTTIVAPATGSDVTMTLPGSSLDLGAELASKLPIAGGKILQIVRATDTTSRTRATNSYADITGMSITISPQKNDSAVLLIASLLVQPGNNSLSGVQWTDSSNNTISGAQDTVLGAEGSTSNFNVPAIFMAYDTPATTNATTYKLRFRAIAGTTEIRNNVSTGQMFALEISA